MFGYFSKFIRIFFYCVQLPAFLVTKEYAIDNGHGMTKKLQINLQEYSTTKFNSEFFYNRQKMISQSSTNHSSCLICMSSCK